MKHILKVIPVFFLLSIVISCGNKNCKYTEEDAVSKFLELSAIDAAKFYADNREANSYFDELYKDMIIPLLSNGDLNNVRDVFQIVKGTPAELYVEDLYYDYRDAYLAETKQEIDSLLQSHIGFYQDELQPILELGVDSLLNEDMEAVMEQYSGGLLNYKKLGLFFGRGEEEFEEAIHEQIDITRYNDLIKESIEPYISELQEFGKAYMESAIDDNYNFEIHVNVPETRIHVSPIMFDALKEYNTKETDEMFSDFIKDYVVPVALDIATGGMSEIVTLYEVGTFAYDIAVTVDDVKNMKPTSEDILSYQCADEITMQIRTQILENVETQLRAQLTANYNQMYNCIENEYYNIENQHKTPFLRRLKSWIEWIKFWEE